MAYRFALAVHFLVNRIGNCTIRGNSGPLLLCGSFSRLSRGPSAKSPNGSTTPQPNYCAFHGIFSTDLSLTNRGIHKLCEASFHAL